MRGLLLLACLLSPSVACADSYAVIDGSNNVVNVIDWDGSSNWAAPNGTYAIKSDGTAEPGGTYSNITKTFTPAPPKTEN